MSRTLIAAAVATALALGAGAAHAFSFFSSASDEGAAKVTREADTLAANQPDWARPVIRALYRDGEWNAVLNLNRLGLAAMEHGAFDLAGRAFDQSIARVEAIYADDANARRARSVFNAERLKDFKGDPYERSMLYFYRGLVYAHGGDYENARAAFLAADRHDTLSSAEDAAFAGDFGMMKYLAGWASGCAGDRVRAAQLVEEARAADAVVRGLPAAPPASLLLLDAGPAPIKWGDGAHREILRLRPGDGDDATPQFRVTGGDRRDFQVLGDVTYQATTRGGREVDGVMAGKARFKDGAGALGDGALTAGTLLLQNAGMSGDRGSANLGLAGMFIGLLSKSVEAAVTPQADLRSWETLPARVLVLGAADPAAGWEMTGGGALSTVPLRGRQGDCALAWTRTRSATPDAVPAASSDAERDRGDRNRAFRRMVAEELVAQR